jgi:hypothetical protein
MKRFVFAVVVAALSAAVGSAQDAVTVTVAPPAPVVMAGPVMTETVTTQPARRGLFGRLRGRNTVTMTSGTMTPMASVPTMATPVMTPSMTPMTTTPAPMMTPGSMPAMPMQMPGSKPAGTAMSGPVVPATGNLPAGIYTTTDGTVVQIGGVMPDASMTTSMTTTTTMTAQTARRGLLARLRNR